jgi:hypothetical protein
MAEVTENHPPESTPPEAEQPAPDAEQPVPDAEQSPAPEPAEDPGYLTETGEAAGEDGSVVPIIGGLPAVEGSAWDIGAPADERGAALAEHEASQEHQAGQEHQASQEDPR